MVLDYEPNGRFSTTGESSKHRPIMKPTKSTTEYPSAADVQRIIAKIFVSEISVRKCIFGTNNFHYISIILNLRT